MTNTSLYVEWFLERGISPVLLPNMVSIETSSGDFQLIRGGIRGVLPYLRLYWSQRPTGQDQVLSPAWQPETWKPVSSQGEGLFRFLRADQALELFDSLHSSKHDGKAFRAQVRHALKEAWFVPIDTPLIDRPAILDARVETVRMSLRSDRQQRTWCVWSRSTGGFPNSVRGHLVNGLDPVHTPENERAGLTRHLCQGWTIDDAGSLACGGDASTWGPSTSAINFRLHDAPRRLMLGSSLQSRAVDLLDEETPDGAEHCSWVPPGRNLRAAFSAFGGWTHEDAVVVSESAAEKLRNIRTDHVDVLIPRIANRVEVAAWGAEVERGQPLVRAFVDLYAMGFRKHDAEAQGALDGWLEIAIPGAEATRDGDLVEVDRRPTPTSSRWRESITFRLERFSAVEVGDKLATPHGVKGVVSRILPDDQMPMADGERAEIVFSPSGIVRRGALGQFREASVDDERRLPRSGTIFVVRQPQSAGDPERFRSFHTTASKPRDKGQRYGEMEFWALMAHGADVIARELLSLDRSTAVWMKMEAELHSSDSRQLALRALNRYLSIIGARVENGELAAEKDGNGRLIVRRAAGAFDIKIPKIGNFDETLESLDDEMTFRLGRGLGVIELKAPVTVAFRIDKDHQCEIVFEAIHVIPPWLRPKVGGVDHKLTVMYKQLLKCLAWIDREKNQNRLPGIIRTLVRIAMGDRVRGKKISGTDTFLRREILGRRLTRSARAVIVPAPDLRIDEIGIPRSVVDVIFGGLGERQRSIVLVNRNPTLQRRGLLALRPVIDESNAAVFRLPLGVLKTLAADFDGDQASIIALETEEAIRQAEGLLLPGCAGLRSDPFRPGEPAFPLVKEMSCIDQERSLAAENELSQDEWCSRHAELVRRRIDELEDGWTHPLSGPINELPEDTKRLWNGIEESDWLEWAKQEMDTVYTSVRKKGRYGGVLRRQLYRRRCTNAETFRLSIDALHSITEPLMQSALSCKSGRGAFSFPVQRFFEDPSAQKSHLAGIDPRKNEAGETIVDECAKQQSRYDEAEICGALGNSIEPTGLLAWLGKPTFESLLGLLTTNASHHTEQPSLDPRIKWFLD